MKIVNVKECGYRTFTSAASFHAAGRLLLARLGSIIADPSLPRPVIVAGHNLPLCKNAALSHAFAGLARDFARTGDDVRFISVVHDFAEQGRTDLMTQAHLLERRGIRIWDALYPDLSNLRFAAVSASARYVLRKAGFRACLVPNAVIAPNGRTTAGACTRGKSIRVHRNIDNRDPVLFYPGRIISRKNPVEALVLSHVFFSSTLVLGEDGTSAADRALYRRLQALCTQYKVRAVFAGARRTGDAEGGYSRLYSNADACVSTSVLEGFGYGLREPWLYGRAVIGRLPCGIAQVEIPGGAGLYKRFFVPKEWIDVEALKRLYLRQMRLCFGSRSATDSAGAFSKAFNREFVRGNGLDFGCLDIATQCAVFEAVCRSGALAEQWKNAFPGQTHVAGHIVGRGIASVNRQHCRKTKTDRGPARQGRVYIVARGMFRKAKGCAGKHAARLPQDPEAFLQPCAVPPPRYAAGARRAPLLHSFPLTFFDIHLIFMIRFTCEEAYMANATKHDLIVEVSKSTGLTQADTKIVVEELLETIAKNLEAEKNIEIRGFGTFYTRIRKPRPARNPKTGEVVPLYKRVVPLFKYSGEFKGTISEALQKRGSPQSPK